MANPLRGQLGDSGFNPLAAGRKHYGGGRSMPTVGKVADKSGYAQRDAKAEARKQALIRRASSKPGQASSRAGKHGG